MRRKLFYVVKAFFFDKEWKNKKKNFPIYNKNEKLFVQIFNETFEANFCLQVLPAF